jgi:hypothetical protein
MLYSRRQCPQIIKTILLSQIPVYNPHSFILFSVHIPASNYKRTVLITGATDGLGKQLAIELTSKVRENFMIVHGRTQRSCEKTLQEIAVEQKVLAPSNVAFIVADFGDFEQVSYIWGCGPSKSCKLVVVLGKKNVIG